MIKLKTGNQPVAKTNDTQKKTQQQQEENEDDQGGNLVTFQKKEKKQDNKKPKNYQNQWQKSQEAAEVPQNNDAITVPIPTQAGGKKIFNKNVGQEKQFLPPEDDAEQFPTLDQASTNIPKKEKKLIQQQQQPAQQTSVQQEKPTQTQTRFKNSSATTKQAPVAPVANPVISNTGPQVTITSGTQQFVNSKPKTNEPVTIKTEVVIQEEEVKTVNTAPVVVIKRNQEVVKPIEPQVEQQPEGVKVIQGTASFKHSNKDVSKQIPIKPVEQQQPPEQSTTHEEDPPKFLPAHRFQNSKKQA